MASKEAVVVFILIQNLFLLTQSEWIDMSHPYHANMSETGALNFQHTLAYAGALGTASHVISFNLKLSEHSGTHIDAPIHFSEGKPTVDEILPENLIGQAIVINITEQALQNPDYEVSVDDIKSWENEYGAIRNGTIVFILTGHGKYWGDLKKYMGIRNASIFRDYHFPGETTI